jgi:hypothetical protein
MIEHVPDQMRYVWKESEYTVTFGMTCLKVTECYNGRLKTRAEHTKKVCSARDTHTHTDITHTHAHALLVQPSGVCDGM